MTEVRRNARKHPLEAHWDARTRDRTLPFRKADCRIWSRRAKAAQRMPRRTLHRRGSQPGIAGSAWRTNARRGPSRLTIVSFITFHLAMHPFTVASLVHSMIVLPGINSIALWRNHGNKIELERQLSSFIALIRAIHDQVDEPLCFT